MTIESIKQFNETLPPQFQQGVTVLNSLFGRYKGAATMSPPVVSPFVTDSIRQRLYAVTQAEEFNQLDGLKAMRDKVAHKWGGPQGGPPDLKALAYTRELYYSKIPIRITANAIPSRVLTAFERYLAPIKEAIKLTGAVIQPHDNPDFLVGSRKSSTGYYGFTSKTSWKWARLLRANELATISFNDGRFYLPMLEWYRFQKQKYRNIYGDAFPNLILGRRYLGVLLEIALKEAPWVHYHHESVSMQRVQAFISDALDVASSEFDYEMMDAHTTEEVSVMTMQLVCNALDLSPDQTEDILKVVQMYFRVPLITMEATIDMRPHNLFSGVFLTNGIEDYLNLLIVLHSVSEACDRLGMDYDYALRHILIEIMGDDSFILNKFKDPHHFAAVLEAAFMDIAPMYGMQANRLKQRIGSSMAWFCKRGYPITYAEISRCKLYPGSDVAIPVYPIDLAINSASFPEQGIRGNPVTDPYYLRDLAATCQRFDDAYGDPAWESVIHEWADAFGVKALRNAIRYLVARDVRPLDDWHKRIRGVEWAPESSCTCRLLMK